jgi:hypothetical protein
MTEGLFGCDPLGWVVHEDLLKEIQELAIEVRGGWNGVLFLVSVQADRDTNVKLTGSFFMALTYLRELRGVSVFG